MRKKRKSIVKNPPIKAAQVPVTVELLYAVRDETRLDIFRLEQKIDRNFVKMSASLDEKLGAQGKRWDGKFTLVMDRLDRIEKLLVRQQVENHEQDARCKYVLDGYSDLHRRIEKLEDECEL